MGFIRIFLECLILLTYPSSNSSVSFGNGHQVAQHSFGLDHLEPDVGGLNPLLKVQGLLLALPQTFLRWTA